MVQARDDTQKITGRGPRSGAAGGDDFLARGFRLPGLGESGNQCVAVDRDVRMTIGGQNVRPVGGYNFKELQNFLPVFCKSLRRQVVKRRRGDAVSLHLVQQAGQFAGQLKRPGAWQVGLPEPRRSLPDLTGQQ